MLGESSGEIVEGGNRGVGKSVCVFAGKKQQKRTYILNKAII